MYGITLQGTDTYPPKNGMLRRWFSGFPQVVVSPNIHLLGGGFKYFLFSPRTLGKISNVTNIFKGVETTNYYIYLHLPIKNEPIHVGKSTVRPIGSVMGYVEEVKVWFSGQWPMQTKRKIEWRLVANVSPNIYIYIYIYI